MGKTGDLFKKVEEIREHFMQAWANRWGKSGIVTDFIFFGSKITVTATMKLKDVCFLEGKL